MPRPLRHLARRPALAAAAALALLLSTCGDPTGPKNVLDITLATMSGASTDLSPDGENPIVVCTVPLRATAKGPGRALWLSSTIRWYAGPDRSSPVDSATFPAEVMASAFGFEDMVGGQEQELQVRVSFPLPFEWELEARYNVGAEFKAAKLRTACGPTPPAGAVAPPTVDAPVVIGRDLLRAGDTVTVVANLSSPYALWATRISVRGPVERDFFFADRGNAVSQHAVRVIIPSDAVLDAALVATITVIDALGQGASREIITPKIVTDLEAPVLTSAHFLDWGAVGSGADEGVPDFGPGDTLGVRVDASDDIRLAHVVVEGEGPGVSIRDSVPFEAIADSIARLPVDARWAGVNRLTVHVRDLMGKRSAHTVSTPVDSLRFFGEMPRAETTIPVAVHWNGAFLDDARARFYIPRLDASVQVVNTATMSLLPSIPLPRVGYGLDVSRGGDSLFVALPDTGIAIVDLRGPAPVTVVVPAIATLTPGAAGVRAFPLDIKRDAEGRWVVWATYDGTGETHLLHFDPAARMFTPVPQDDGPRHAVYVWQSFMATSADRERLVTLEHDCIRLYRSATARFGPCRPALAWPSGIPAPMFAPSGDLITIGHGAYDGDLTIAAEQGLARPTSWTNIAHSADGTTRWVAEHSYVDRVRVSDGRRTARTFLLHGISRLWLSDDGTTLYVEGRNSTSLTRLDVR